MTYRKFIAGTPKAQPRPKAARRGKHIVIYNPNTADEWKKAINQQTGDCPHYFDEAVKVTIVFCIARPKSHYRTGKYSMLLKDSAPDHHTSKPDIDNLEKAVLDSLVNSNILKDDSIVTEFPTRKLWVDGGESGCLLKIEIFKS
jgi:Holliday junction resolvase RusA-like endonuclease